MFSRSEKTEEVTEAAMAEPSEQRSPMVLAALAGLLAIAGAFLLVWYLSNGDDATVAQGADGEPAAVGGTSSSSETDKQVLVVTQAIPRGTSVRELIDAPTVYLSARAVPEQFVAASAITSVAELTELDGLVLASEALPGEQLLRGRFRDPNDFTAGSESTFLEDATDIDIPEGHHAIVVELPASRALGGLLRKGEVVTVIANMRISPPDTESQEVSLVVLNAVEVLNVDSSLEFAGQVSQDFDSVGTANRGSFTVTLAVKPNELTDLTYAISYGEIMLATALPGAENTEIRDGEEVPTARAVTGQRQIAGDDGVWLEQLEDSNVVGLVELFPAASEDATSIEVELPEGEEAADEPAEEEPAPVEEETDADLGDS